MIVVALAGGLGAVARFAFDALLRRFIRTAVPWPTVIINVTGSFLLGLLSGLLAQAALPAAVVTIAGTGFLGGYTTFSTAMLEAARLLQTRQRLAAALSIFATLVLAALGAALGFTIGAQGS